MAYDIVQLSNDLTSVLHGTTTQQITNLYGVFNRAARQVLLDCDPQETKRITAVTNAVFNSIWNYSCPSDLKGNRIIDLFPQVNRSYNDVAGQQYNQAFDVKKSTSLLNNFTILWNTGVKSLRINAPTMTQAPIVLNSCDSLTGNGTWAATAPASNLSVDTVNYVGSSGSLKFDIAITGPTAYIENSTMSAIDLTTLLNQGTLFLYTYLPTASAFTNINIRFGSSSTAYYSINATVTQENTAFANGWNLIAFPWSSATTTGSPDVTAIDYIRVTWTYSGAAQTAVRLDQITGALGTIMNLKYYSKYMFRDSSTGAFQETVTADSNLINLDTESYNLLTYKVAEFSAQQQQGRDALQYDGAYFSKLYQEALQRYQGLYKSEVQKPQNTYYSMPSPRNSSYVKVRSGY